MLYLLACVETGVDRIKGEGVYQPHIAVEPRPLRRTWAAEAVTLKPPSTY